MKINHFISKIKLLESTIILDTPRGEQFIVYKNPSKEQTKSILSKSTPNTVYKGIISGKNLYLWNAFWAHHRQVANELGLNSYNEFILYDSLLDANYLTKNDFKVFKKCFSLDGIKDRMGFNFDILDFPDD